MFDAYTWVGGSGEWNDVSHWFDQTTGQAAFNSPTTFDSATINTTGVTVSGSGSASYLTTGSNVTLAMTSLAVEHDANIGPVDVVGSYIFDGNLVIHGPVDVGDGGLTCYSNLTIDGAVNLVGNGGMSSFLVMSINGTIESAVGSRCTLTASQTTVGGDVTVNGDATITGLSGYGPSTTNGNVHVASGGSLYVDYSIINGDVNVQGGILGGVSTINGTFDCSGQSAVATGAGFIEVNGPLNVAALSQLRFAGSATLNDTVSIDDSSLLVEPDITGAPAGVTITDHTISTGTSQFVAEGGGTINLPQLNEVDSGTLMLGGSIKQISSGILNGGTWEVFNGSTLQLPDILENQASIDLDGAGSTVQGWGGVPLTLFSNVGSIGLADGASFSTVGNLANGGKITLGGSSTFTVNGNFTQTPNARLEAQASGATFHVTGDLGNTGTVTLLPASELNVDGSLGNTGTLILWPQSMLKVAGDFAQTGTGELYEEIGGSSASKLFGQATVTGDAALGGALYVDLLNGYVPKPADVYHVMTSNSVTGSFANENGLPQNLIASVKPTSLDLLFADAVETANAIPIVATEGTQLCVVSGERRSGRNNCPIANSFATTTCDSSTQRARC